ADLIGAACGCLALIALLDQLGAPGVVMGAAVLAFAAAILFAPHAARARMAGVAAAAVSVALIGQVTGLASFDVIDTKGHQGDRVLFSKWNSFSRIGVYERTHGDWSLSPAYHGPLPDTRYMDIDSAASTPILHAAPDLSNVQYLRYELTALAYDLKANPESPLIPNPGTFTARVICPGGGRDLAPTLAFWASRADGVAINPSIATDVVLA